MTEVEQALELKSQEQKKITAYRRLELNPDFKVFAEEIEKRRQSFRDILEVAPKEEIDEIRGQLKAIRGIMDLFNATVSRESQVNQDIKELKIAKSKIRKKG